MKSLWICRYATALRMKRTLSILLRVVIALAGIAYIVWSVELHDQLVLPAGYAFTQEQMVDERARLAVVQRDDHAYGVIWEDQQHWVPREAVGVDGVHLTPGLGTMLRQANHWLLAAGLLVMLPMLPLQAWRWMWLMRCRGLQVMYGRVLQLTMVGMFFNICMPGMTGGDVVKAYYAAKGTDRRGTAILSVVLDRLCGLLALIILGALVGLTMWHDPLAMWVNLGVWALLIASVVGAWAYFSQGFRRLIGLHRLLSNMRDTHPLYRLDQTILAYRHHRGTVAGAVGLSMGVHLLNLSAAILAGWAVGISHGYLMMLTILPLIFMAGSLPMTYLGLGVMEGLGRAMLEQPELASANQIVGMLMMVRLYMIFFGLVGSIFVFKGDIHLHPPREATGDRDQ